MDLANKTRKEVGALGERAAALWLSRKGFRVIDRNVLRKTGELDLIARKGQTLHFVEVKSLVCPEFPNPESREDAYDPSENLHPGKIRRVARTAEWYVAEKEWEGEWQVDGALVWLRERDGLARIEYLPQIV
jgi:putative endonuclease